MTTARLLPILAVLAAAACAAPSADDSSSEGSAVVQAHLAARAVNAAIAKLDDLRSSDPIGRYYEDGNRVEGCWKNPAGNKLTDLKKALYCSYPLEFRLCNTVVLLTVDESDVAGRYQGYVDCQDKVAAILGDRFHFDASVNAVYKSLYLEGAKLSAADTSAVVSAKRPEDSGRSFPILLAHIGASLVEEGKDLLVEDALAKLSSDLEARSGAVK